MSGSNNNNTNNNNRQRVNQPSIVVKGRVISGADLREYAERNGLCPECGVYQTHKKTGNFLKPRFEPLTVTNAYNEITVYKGYCIAPTCYTLERAKQLLGEIPTKQPSKRNINMPSSSALIEQAQQAQQSTGGWGGSGDRVSWQPQQQPYAAPPNLQSAASSGSTRPRATDDSLLLQAAQSQVRRLDLQGGGLGEASSSNHAARAFPISDGSGHRYTSDVGGGSSHHKRSSTADSFHTRTTIFQPKQAPSTIPQEASYTGNYGRGSGAPSSTAPSLLFQDSFGRAAAASTTFDRNSGGASNASGNPYEDGKQRALPSISYPGSPVPHMVGSDRTPSTITEHTEPSACEDPVVKSMEEKIQESNYLEFMNLLDHKQREPFIITEGFRLLRSYVVRDHLLKPEGVVLVGDNWVKVINEKIQMFAQQGNREVVISGLVTLLTISRQSGSYKRSLIRKDAMEMIMKLFEQCHDDEEIMDTACAVVISLSLHEKHSLNAKSFPRIATLVRKLAYVVLTADYTGKTFALRALFHISNQRKKSEATGKTALHDVRNAIGQEPIIRAMLETIQPSYTIPPFVEAGLALLWKICLPREDDMTRVLGMSVENVNSIVLILEQSDNQEVLESACGLIANLAIEEGFPADLAHRAVTRICDLVANPELRTPEIANVAVHAFCNLLASQSAKPGVLGVNAVLSTTLLFLKEFQGEEEVVEYACLALSHASLNKPEIKRYISGPDSFPLIHSAFNSFVRSSGHQPSLPIKDATLCAFGAISGCEVGVQALTDSGLASTLESMHAIEMDADFKLILEAILRNVANQLDGGGGTMNIGGGMLRQQPAIFFQMLRNAVSEEDILSLIQELRDIGEAGVPALGNHGFDELLAVMAHYEYSALVQKECCSLLAEIYYRMPMTDVEAPTQLPGGTWAILHKKAVVDLVCNSIRSHPQDVATQIAGMAALTNLLVPLCEIDSKSPHLLQVQGWLAPVWTQTMEALTSHTGDAKLQEAGFRLCWVLTIISSENELRNWVLSLLQQIFDTMGRFPEEHDLNVAACDILVPLSEDQDCADFMGNSNCVGALVEFLDEDSTDLVVRASAILSSLVGRVFVAVSQLLQVPNILRRLIACMNSQAAEHYVAIHLSIVLETFINVEDVNMRYSILESGGLPALTGAMSTHQSNHILCKHACRVLTLIVPYLDPQSLGLLSGPLGTFIALLQVHVDNPETEAAILDLLWAIGSMDDYFKSVILTEQNLRVIIQAMSCHLGSDDVQRSGCGMLWLLSGFGDGKRMIGNAGGIQAILNAMLAHNQSTSIQKEGLTALKNLATEANNKSLLTENDCTRVVMYSLWINYQHPLVISCALSALNNIAIDSRTKSVAPLPSEILEITLSAMRRFPKDEILQKNACFYLKSCTYLADNRVLMKSRSGDLMAALQQASNTFPQSCQQHAHGIMKKIQQ